MQKVPFMIVLGDREKEEGIVSVRERREGDIGAMSLDELKELLDQMKETRALNYNR
jgi:threonyl-tRNA synthetase